MSVSPTLIQIYCTVLYCPPFCSVVLFMPPPHQPNFIWGGGGWRKTQNFPGSRKGKKKIALPFSLLYVLDIMYYAIRFNLMHAHFVQYVRYVLCTVCTICVLYSMYDMCEKLCILLTEVKKICNAGFLLDRRAPVIVTFYEYKHCSSQYGCGKMLYGMWRQVADFFPFPFTPPPPSLSPFFAKWFSLKLNSMVNLSFMP